MRLAACVGTYEEGNPSCDGGGPESAAECGQMELCSWARDWCVENEMELAVFMQMLGKDGTAEDLEKVRRDGWEVFAAPAKQAPKRGRRGPMEIPETCWSLFSHFENLLRDRFGDKRVPRTEGLPKPRVVMVPGVFYSVNRVEPSRYMAWYCKSTQRTDLAIACLHVKTISATVNVQLPWELELVRKRFSAVTLAKLNPQEHLDGQFKIVCRRLGYEELGVVVTMFKRLIDKRDYLLPRIEGR